LKQAFVYFLLVYLKVTNTYKLPKRCNKVPEELKNLESSTAANRSARALSPASYDRKAARAVNDIITSILLNYHALVARALLKRAGNEALKSMFSTRISKL
jgi:hypothetical protein